MPNADSGRPLLQFRIALALRAGKGYACLGWTFQPEACIERCTLFFEDGSSTTLDRSTQSLQLHHTVAPELDDGSTPRGPGFVLWLPDKVLRKAGVPLLTLNDQVAELDRPPLCTPAHLLQNHKLLTAFGPTLLALAQQQHDAALQRALAAPLQQLRDERSAQFGRVDQAWHLQDTKLLLITGRLACPPSQITRCMLNSGKHTLDVTSQLHTAALPPAAHGPHTPPKARDSKGSTALSDACNFALLLDCSTLPGSSARSKAQHNKAGAQEGAGQLPPLQLQIDSNSLAGLTLALQPLPGTLQHLPEILEQAAAVAQPLLSALFTTLAKPLATARVAAGASKQHSTDSKRPAAEHRHALQLAAHALFTTQWQHASHQVQHSNLCTLKLTTACALDDQGLLLLGTFVRPATLPFTLWLHAEGHLPLDVSPQLQFLPVFHGLERLRKHFPQASEQLFFILHAPLPTQGGERRLLRLQINDAPDLWLKVETPQPQLRGVDQAKALLAEIPHSEFLWRSFKQVCDAGLGRALHWLGRPPLARSPVVAEQFGTPPRKPNVSIIVPLYGRYDFLRHQLAQFCKDPDFANVDLIYVVDDPSIHAAALAAASHYQPLFGVPFRMLTYAENRGFAGANNSAVPFARAPLLLLLNSDVLPQESRWLQTLQRAYARLPQCGMVGPLLQFPEGSVQHAGMAATRQSNVPDLIFSHHPGKGGAWEGGNTPSEQPLLTGACLLLSKQDYEAVGGLDENYLVGDFEDSDFSLRLRGLGKRLYLVPAARLWHLERQSQYLGNNATAVRDMLTLYNAWRYHNKIAAGLLPNPEQSSKPAQTRKQPRTAKPAARRSKARS